MKHLTIVEVVTNSGSSYYEEDTEGRLIPVELHFRAEDHRTDLPDDRTINSQH